MSYQVLARKWRPQQFSEMVGQRHVLKALVNALDQARLHHAYLFTGTRGVGKTTLARLFAKSLNCEEGVSSSPCGVCSSCREIAENRFVDLIEVDAASRTKVEDTRELLDNVQYAPTRGRYKVYLIDEVHMLSNHSFNALLKTLEEPPPHVKFLLATTDPQKLPVTVLSRCLQFNLKSMTPEMVVGHLESILQREAVSFEPAALLHLGKAAQGSMRDALSLTDQAVAYGEGQIREAEVAEMLGTVDTRQVLALVEGLCRQDARSLLASVDRLAEYTPDWQSMMADLLAVLHQLTILQLAPEYEPPAHGEALREIAARFAPEDIQLFYQLGLQAHRDLETAPDARQGFEMALLRMLAFTPDKPPRGERPELTPTGSVEEPSAGGNEPSAGGNEPSAGGEAPLAGATEPAAEKSEPSAAAETQAAAATEPASADNEPPTVEQALVPQPAEQPQEPMPSTAIPQSVAEVEHAAAESADLPWSESPPPTAAPTVQPNEPEVAADSNTAPAFGTGTSQPTTEPGHLPEPTQFPEATRLALDRVAADVEMLPEHWLDLIPALELTGVMENLMRHAVVRDLQEGRLALQIDPEYQRLYEESYRGRVEEALQALDIAVTHVEIEFADAADETLHQREQRRRREALAAARTSLEQDQLVQTLARELGAELLPETIEPVPRG